MKLIDHLASGTVIDTDAYHLEQDSQYPALVALGLALPVIPQNGTVEISFTAGYGPDWSDVPPDLGRAVLMLAADFYENRASRDGTSLPSGILAVLERFRKVRLLGGV